MNAFCTVVTPSHLCWAIALARSLKASDNLEPLYVLFISEESFTGTLPDNLRLCTLNQITRTLPDNIYWYFDNFELCNALKPFIVEWVLQQGFQKALFLDSDLYIVGSFDPVWSALENADLLLTPHHIFPPSLALSYINEAAVSDMGILNGGFMAWQSGDTTEPSLIGCVNAFHFMAFVTDQKGCL